MNKIDYNDVEDKAMYDITFIDVTQDDIDKGKKSDSQSCPIANAMNRQYGMPVSVGFQYIYSLADIKRAKLWIRPITTFPYVPVVESMRKFINSFDEGEDVEPTQFEITRIGR